MHGNSQHHLSAAEHGVICRPAAAAHGMDRRGFISLAALAGGGALLGGLPGAAEAARVTSLQGQLVSLVNRLRAEGKIRWDEKTSWSVYDFSSRKKLVSVNDV